MITGVCVFELTCLLLCEKSRLPKVLPPWLGLWVVGCTPALLRSDKNRYVNRLVDRLDGWMVEWTWDHRAAFLLRRLGFVIEQRR